MTFVHCEEETGAYYQLSQFTYKLIIVFLKKIKVINFVRKKMHFSKNSIKFIIQFFSKRDNWHMYISTKCNDTFKFTISLES